MFPAGIIKQLFYNSCRAFSTVFPEYVDKLILNSPVSPKDDARSVAYGDADMTQKVVDYKMHLCKLDPSCSVTTDQAIAFQDFFNRIPELTFPGKSELEPLFDKKAADPSCDAACKADFSSFETSTHDQLLELVQTARKELQRCVGDTTNLDECSNELAHFSRTAMVAVSSVVAGKPFTPVDPFYTSLESFQLYIEALTPSHYRKYIAPGCDEACAKHTAFKAAAFNVYWQKQLFDRAGVDGMSAVSEANSLHVDRRLHSKERKLQQASAFEGMSQCQVCGTADDVLKCRHGGQVGTLTLPSSKCETPGGQEICSCVYLTPTTPPADRSTIGDLICVNAQDMANQVYNTETQYRLFKRSMEDFWAAPAKEIFLVTSSDQFGWPPSAPIPTLGNPQVSTKEQKTVV